jgi:hypothetical protein
MNSDPDPHLNLPHDPYFTVRPRRPNYAEVLENYQHLINKRALRHYRYLHEASLEGMSVQVPVTIELKLKPNWQIRFQSDPGQIGDIQISFL